MELAELFETEDEDLRQIAKRLQKRRLTGRVNHKNAVVTMARRGKPSHWQK